MFFILLIAIVLLYFILAAQFESLVQPLLVLIEIPIDLTAVLVVLYLGGSSINLMSMIGMVVMSGIIINDSILKIDTINRLRHEGYGLDDAIHEAGLRRIKPIVMTSLTTILAMIPFLFGGSLGTILQKPLAIVIIAGMIYGTFISLFLIPILYRQLYK
ncbi:efflux RND transporter permease subunit [Halosquirtibacter laminarini]|uniref:Efflux RND transporter permease subunit n=2 Tax=Halosquirtibacter laminarini TaxID=3374600 RepID=A0AC61NEJ6_9BACT|nr:efflux RND transporter permease subunit [Prolixibacteraceae bacterium]